MLRKFYILICLCVYFAGGNKISLAQDFDTRLRQKVSVAYQPIKAIELSGSYRLDLDQNISTFQKSNFELGFEYRIVKGLDLLTSYRWMTAYEKNTHRFEAGFAYKKNSQNKKFQFQLRSVMNFNSDYLDRDYWRMSDPTWVWRNRFRGKYDFSKKWSGEIFVELFLKSKGKENALYRVRYGAELSYDITKRHSINLGYYVQDEFRERNPNQNQTIELGYKLNIKKKKKVIPISEI